MCSLKVAVGTPGLRWTILLVVLMGFTMRTGFWLYEPYFVRIDIPILWYGPIFGVFNIIAALSARFLAHRSSSKSSALPTSRRWVPGSMGR